MSTLVNNDCLASRKHQKRVEFQTFCRQLYHACLAYIFSSLKSSMTTPEVVRCPDGHYRQAVFSLGPYIADYPEQVWLTGIVQHWCPTYDIVYFANHTYLPFCLGARPLPRIWMSKLIYVPMRRHSFLFKHLILASSGIITVFVMMLL